MHFLYLAFGSAEAEAGRQFGATQTAPGLAAQDFVDINALLGVGQAQEGLSAAQLQEDISRFQFEQAAPGLSLNDLIGQLTGTAGQFGTTSISQPGVAQPSQFLTGAGGALSGAATGASIGGFGGPAGAAAGAGLGGVIGLLGGLL